MPRLRAPCIYWVIYVKGESQVPAVSVCARVRAIDGLEKLRASKYYTYEVSGRDAQSGVWLFGVIYVRPFVFDIIKCFLSILTM